MEDPPGRPKPSFREEEPAAAPSTSRLARGEFRPETVVNPPPKFRAAGYRVPPERMFDAVLGAFRAEGVVVEALDRREGLVRGSQPMGGSAGSEAAAVTAAITPSDTGGSRLTLSYDRPPGSRMDPFADGRRLEALFAAVDAALAG